MSTTSRITSALTEIQSREGFLSKSNLEDITARDPELTLHRIHEVSSFFPHYRADRPAGLEVRLCRDMACYLAGAPSIKKELESIAAEAGPGRIEVRGVSCLGQCDAAPAGLIGGHLFQSLTSEQASSAILETLQPSVQVRQTDPRRSPLPSVPTAWRIDPYEGNEDYAAVRRFVANPDVGGLLGALKTADLRGMGGAGVWVHQKWTDVRQAAGDLKYVVVNGDESEPSTFKDRELLKRAPHLVIEGLILAGLAVGASRGYVFIRHEYEEQIDAVRSAIGRAEAMGVCGSCLLGTGQAFPVEVFVSPGGYICGEQSALVEAMEGKRAEPRNKPPTLETHGLNDCPTLLGNVESFAWVPSIAVKGGEWYRDLGTNGSSGMRFFSICGDLKRPGVFEVPIGITLRDLVEMAGGLRDGRRLKAFAPSGPSGGFLPARLPRNLLPRGFEKRVPPRFLAERFPDDASHLDVLDLELDLQLFRDLGLMLGSGMVIYDDRANMVDQALNASEFYRNESCGKCVPCRIGSQKTVELATGLIDGTYDLNSLPDVESLMTELRQTMELTSICGLGMVAPNPMASVFRYFRDDLEVCLRTPIRPTPTRSEGRP